MNVTNHDLESLVDLFVSNPEDRDTRLILADALEECGRYTQEQLAPLRKDGFVIQLSAGSYHVKNVVWYTKEGGLKDRFVVEVRAYPLLCIKCDLLAWRFFGGWKCLDCIMSEALLRDNTSTIS